MNEAEEVQLHLICKISTFFHYPNTIPILGLYIGIMDKKMETTGIFRD